MEKHLISQKGLDKLKKELEYLKNVKRKEIAQGLKKAASYGDLSENAEYQEMKETQAFVEGRILELEKEIDSAVVAPKNKNKNSIQMGSVIRVSCNGDKQTFTIVGPGEAKPEKGEISTDSPLGSAFLNKKEGDVVEINTPRGKFQYKILKIE